MSKSIDYYFSLVSPWTYLGAARLAEIAHRHGAEVGVRPVQLARIFPATGGLPLAKRAPERQAYRLAELRRWADHLGLPLTLKPKYFPADETVAAHLVIAADMAGHDALGLSQAILTAVWAEERDIADRKILTAIATACGIDADTLWPAADAPAAAERYGAYTAEALERGVFGAPTYVYGGELFWGQDRLDFLDRALAAG